MSNADWMPGIAHDPGTNAGYNAGMPRMDTLVLHYTAGAYGGDYDVGKRGYFNFYCPRDMPAVQFAEGNALTWHAGEWNDAGPGIEMERRDDSYAYTDHQLHDLGRIAHWLHDRYGIPLDRFYDTGGDNNARIGEGASAGTCITHRSLAQSGGWHSDYLTHDEWNRALGGAPAPPNQRRTDVIYREENGQYWEMGFGDYVLVPEAVGIGAGLNGAAVVPIKTAERIVMGGNAVNQAKAFLRSVGLLDPAADDDER